MTHYDVEFWIGPWDRERILEEKPEIQVEAGVQLIVMPQSWCLNCDKMLTFGGLGGGFYRNSVISVLTLLEF